ncbi:hypothetical protein H4Q26_015679 [Puccinia striiformis f. sp. tritici PST-130]|nr:hypothetical protein H4Q26_015679 [Puccinia striiformis f. sp. tritici PST-130]KNE92959.1 hypothetical protein PSTG_13675 [Puccinia striiformis f. sp. tritici PST-78]
MENDEAPVTPVNLLYSKNSMAPVAPTEKLADNSAMEIDKPSPESSAAIPTPPMITHGQLAKMLKADQIWILVKEHVALMPRKELCVLYQDLNLIRLQHLCELSGLCWRPLRLAVARQKVL